MLRPSHTISHIIACRWELFSQSLKQAKLLSQQKHFFCSVIAKALRINVRSVCTVLLFNIVRATHTHLIFACSYVFDHQLLYDVVKETLLLSFPRLRFSFSHGAFFPFLYFRTSPLFILKTRWQPNFVSLQITGSINRIIHRTSCPLHHYQHHLTSAEPPTQQRWELLFPFAPSFR